MRKYLCGVLVRGPLNYEGEIGVSEKNKISVT